ncbi:MAG: UMP kinase [Candidatus Cloacimonadota bacterium]|nr:UMP kinase [Candidatus Cloacimonadota bacterium]
MTLQYKPEKIHRIIFKISGEILAGKEKFGIDMDKVDYLIEEILSVKKLGFSIGVVIGGGNIFRGASKIGEKLHRFTADNVGMIATVQNALILADQLKKKNYQAEVFSAIQLDKVAKFYTPNRAETSLNEGKTCFFCAGTGNPFFTTDTAAVLRAIELNADIVFKGTKVDGVYTTDPFKDEKATLLKNITYEEAISKQLKIMDMTAFSLAREHNMAIKVFNVLKKNNFKEALLNEEIGTFIHV